MHISHRILLCLPNINVQCAEMFKPNIGYKYIHETKTILIIIINGLYNEHIWCACAFIILDSVSFGNERLRSVLNVTVS